MTTALAETKAPALDAKVVESVLLGGDLSKLTPEQRISYYNRICEGLGLNPLTKPFAYITLNGKLQLYALKDATEQLRKLHGVSITEVSSQQVGDVFVVTAKAQDKGGRTDASTGAVAIGNLKGETLANALMKAETKAKRRVTLSICGLGMLDETEVDSIPHAQIEPTVVVEPLPEAPTVPLPEGAVLLRKVEQLETSAGKLYFQIVTHQGESLMTWGEQAGKFAEQACQDGTPVRLQVGRGRFNDMPVIKSLTPAFPPEPIGEQLQKAAAKELTASDIPF